MFEEMTYENLLQDVLDNAPEDIDTRPGSIFYDAVSGILIKVAKLYTDLNLVFSLSQIETTAGEYLDVKASEYGVERHSAVAAVYEAIIDGTVPAENERFFYDGLYFIFRDNCFEAEEAGTEYNNIAYGTAAVPVDSISGLKSSAFGNPVSHGSDAEDDESLRRRLKDRISGTGENGNKQNYKVWCESIDGVGKAKIYPLWNGPNTVKAVLIGIDGKPCSESIVAEVQEYVDPDSSGLGEGKANIGAHFTAAAAIAESISISVEVEAAEEYKSLIVQEIRSRLAEYLKKIIMETPDNEKITVRYSAVGNLLLSIDKIADYRNLKINGSSANIQIESGYIPVTGDVNVEIIQ